MHIVLFGVQGCGKGTQAAKIVEHFGSQFAYFSPGDIFRSLTARPNALGDFVQDTLAAGKLIDDSFTIGLFHLYTQTLQGRAMLLDGYPRSEAQMHDVFAYRQKTGEQAMAINLALSQEKAIERMMSRGREDDTPETISQRLKEYDQKTQPLLDLFGQKYPLHTVDASLSIDDVFATIKTIIA